MGEEVPLMFDRAASAPCLAVLEAARGETSLHGGKKPQAWNQTDREVT